MLVALSPAHAYSATACRTPAARSTSGSRGSPLTRSGPAGGSSSTPAGGRTSTTRRLDARSRRDSMSATSESPHTITCPRASNARMRRTSAAKITRPVSTKAEMVAAGAAKRATCSSQLIPALPACSGSAPSTKSCRS